MGGGYDHLEREPQHARPFEVARQLEDAHELEHLQALHPVGRGAPRLLERLLDDARQDEEEERDDRQHVRVQERVGHEEVEVGRRADADGELECEADVAVLTRSLRHGRGASERVSGGVFGRTQSRAEQSGRI